MLRLLRAIGVKRDQGKPEQISMSSPKPQGHTSDPRITREMAWKLFGEPEPMLAQQVVPEPVQAAEAKSGARFRTELTPSPTPDPLEGVRSVAEEESRFKTLLQATTGPVRRDLAKAVPELA